MSVEAFAWALGSRVGNPTRKLILMGYANHAHRDGRHAWCSIGTVADYAECDRRTAQRHVAALVADGFMREGDQDEARRRSARPGNRLPIVYDLAMDEPTRQRWRSEHVPGGRRAEHALAGAAGGRASAASRRTRPRGDNSPPQPPAVESPAADTKPQADTGDNSPPQPPRPGRGGSTNPTGVTDAAFRGDSSLPPESSFDPSGEPPPPRGRARQGATAAAWDPASVEELAAEVTLARPDWAAIIRETLSSAELTRLSGGSWERARRAVLAVAADPESNRPGRVLQPGRWWAPPPPPTPGPAPCTDRTGLPADYQPGPPPGAGAAESIAWIKEDLRRRPQTRYQRQAAACPDTAADLSPAGGQPG